MKIIFLNTWHGKIKDGLEAFVDSQKKDTDIFCLQEADGDAETVFNNSLPGFSSIRIGKYKKENDRYAQAIYVGENIIIKSSGSVLKDNIQYGLDQYIQLDVKGKPIWLSNVHGTPVPREKFDTTYRIEQSRLLIDFFKDKEGIKIIGGDFNLFPNTKSIKMFGDNGYNNLIDRYKIETTRNHYAWELWPDNKHYFSDYVFSSNNINVKTFKVVDNEISDHLPMILEF